MPIATPPGAVTPASVSLPAGSRSSPRHSGSSDLLAELEDGADRWPVCVVSHGGTLRIMARVLLATSTTAPWSIDIDNASLSVCSARDDRWRLDRWNDTLHLLGTTATHVDEMEGRPLAL